MLHYITNRPEVVVPEHFVHFIRRESHGSCQRRVILRADSVGREIVDAREDALLADAQTPGEDGFFQYRTTIDDRPGFRLHRVKESFQKIAHFGKVSALSSPRERNIVLINEEHHLLFIMLCEHRDHIAKEALS